MKSNNFAMVILAALVATPVYVLADQTNTIQIESKNASGKSQTTIIDTGGSLQIVDQPAPTPPPQNVPPQTPAQASQGTKPDSSTMTEAAPSTPPQSLPAAAPMPTPTTPTTTTPPPPPASANAPANGTTSGPRIPSSLPTQAQPAQPIVTPAQPAQPIDMPIETQESDETTSQNTPYGQSVPPQPQSAPPPTNVPPSPSTGIPMGNQPSTSNGSSSMQITPSDAKPTQGMENTSSAEQLVMGGADAFEALGEEEQIVG